MASPCEKPPPYTPFPTYHEQPPLNPESFNALMPSTASGYQSQQQQFAGQQSPIWANQPPPGLSSYPNYGSTVVIQPQPQIIIIGGCPACRVGVLEDDFTCLGIFMAIVCFPLGLLCCMALRQRRCPACGAVFE